ncbi:MAG: hypothetical protein U1A77_14900 [Pirellulales bacterium]
MVVKSVVGLESFMDSASEGWSLVATKAPLERVARVIQRRDDLLVYEPDVSFRPLRGNPVLRREIKRRRCFALQLVDSPWTVLLRTVDWITPEDALHVRRMAADLSSQLVTETLASVAAYEGAECRRFRFGMELSRVDTDDPGADFLEFCHEQEFHLPACFIGFDGDQATLYLENTSPAEVRRVDRLLLRA